MKQKIVIKINVKCDECHNEALKIASNVKCVESVAIQGRDRNHVVVTGEGVDSVHLTRTLRKKMGCAEIIGVGRMNAELEESEEPRYQYHMYHNITSPVDLPKWCATECI